MPPAKRRDDVVWETRMRMRAGAAPSPRHKKMVPNTYVPATDKRRDGLRWQVRAEWTAKGLRRFGGAEFGDALAAVQVALSFPPS